jgi:hypothetical protein
MGPALVLRWPAPSSKQTAAEPVELVATRADPGPRNGPGGGTERRVRAAELTGSDCSGADHLRL